MRTVDKKIVIIGAGPAGLAAACALYKLGERDILLLKREKILVTSGTGFHWPEPDHFRIVYLPNLDTLQSAMRKLTRFFGDYYQG